MRLICIAAMALSIFCSCNRKTAISMTHNTQSYVDTRGNPMLLGVHIKADLQQSPYKEWFDKNYNDYTIDAASVARIQPLIKDKQFEIFMGTWCGDSKREVPRMYKILENAGVRPAQIKLIMVDVHDSAYKQSPTHEERGKQIHRVPDLLVYDDKKEINRVVESPVVSLEKDLLAILETSSYQPNYKAASWLLRLSEEKNAAAIMNDKTNVIASLQPMVQHSSELNSLGYTLMHGGAPDKALMVFELNALLFPNDVNVYDSLGEINAKLDKKEEAKKYYKKVLEMQPGNENAVKMMEKLK